MEKFLIGALAGGIAGALIVSNNAKMRMLVKKGEDELKEKVGAMVDEKLTAMLNKCDEMKNAAAGSQGGSQNEQNGKNAEETQSEETQSGEKQNKKKSRKKEAKNA